MLELGVDCSGRYHEISLYLVVRAGYSMAREILVQWRREVRRFYSNISRKTCHYNYMVLSAAEQRYGK